MTARRYGFTLVELLAALAISAIILLAASSFLASSADGYSRLSNDVATEREARALIRQISSELSSSVFHPDMPARPGTAVWANGEIGFLCLMPADAQDKNKQIGDLCAVHYYTSDLDIGGRTIRCIMRGFHDSQSVFDALKNGTIADLFMPDPVADEPIALNVISFDPIPQVFDNSGRWVDAPFPLIATPAGLKIRVILVRPSLSNRMKSTDDWNGNGQPDVIRDLGTPDGAADNQHLRVFESIIPFAPDASA